MMPAAEQNRLNSWSFHFESASRAQALAEMTAVRRGVPAGAFAPEEALSE